MLTLPRRVFTPPRCVLTLACVNPTQAAVAPLARQPTLEPQPKLRRSVVCVAAAAAAAESPQSLAPRAQQHLPQSFSMSVSLADFTPPAVLTSAPIVPQSSTSPSGEILPRPVCSLPAT
jgi:hypothetical protein